MCNSDSGASVGIRKIWIRNMGGGTIDQELVSLGYHSFGHLSSNGTFQNNYDIVGNRFGCWDLTVQLHYKSCCVTKQVPK